MPFVPAIFRPDDRTTALILRQGEIAADRASNSGNMWANLVSQAGRAGQGYFQDRQAAEQHAQALAAKQAAEAPKLAQEEELRGLDIQTKKSALEKQARDQFETAKVGQLFSQGVPTVESLAPVVGPERAAKILEGFSVLQDKDRTRYSDSKTAIKKVLEGFSASPEGIQAQTYGPLRQEMITMGHISPDMVPETYDPNWVKQALAYGQEAPKPETGFSLSPGEVRFGPDGKQIASVAPKPEKTSQAKTWVMRPTADGKLEPMFVMESEVRPGDRPANTREQGRPVTSGDAGKLAELDNSIQLATGLRGTLKTGAASQIGAAMPNFVTEATGIGAESKTMQGKINLVKQIIGKALEGGVLRKEDEAKYAKIIPTIGDADEVADGKIALLLDALNQKKENELSAREDAGYDVSRFRERAGSPVAAPKAGANPKDPFGIR